MLKDQNMQNEKYRKLCRAAFFVIVGLAFLSVFIYNYYTPMLSDDFSYGLQVRKAHSFADLIRQEYEQYLNWNGRSVVHLLLRITLSLPTILFKFSNSIVFTILLLLMYLNIESRKKHDLFVLLISLMGLWLFTVDFRQTVLWQTGACNYLWGSTIILGFMTLAEKLHEKEVRTGKTLKNIPVFIGFFVFGVAAGWCNENTSGAALLFILYLHVRCRIRTGKLSPLLLCAAAGNIAGLFIMVSAPGNAIRSSYRTELHSGLVGLSARFMNITMTIRDYFFILIVVFFAEMIVLILQAQDGRDKDLKKRLERPLLFAFLFLAASYALLLTSATQPRAFFGAGLFLLVAVIQGMQECMLSEKQAGKSVLMRSACWSVLAFLLLHFTFTYIECGGNLVRIKRDVNERFAYIEEQKAAGEEDITVAQVHPSFFNDYSAIEEMELSEAWQYWTNVGYAEYFEVSTVCAIPYDDWAVMTGRETQEEADISRAIEEEDELQGERRILIPGF